MELDLNKKTIKILPVSPRETHSQVKVKYFQVPGHGSGNNGCPTTKLQSLLPLQLNETKLKYTNQKKKYNSTNICKGQKLIQAKRY